MLQDLIRIYWPIDIIKYEECGLLIGFQNSQNDLFVITCIKNIEKDILEKYIQQVIQEKMEPFKKIEKLCDKQYPKIIGTLHSTLNNCKCIFDYEKVWIDAILDKNTKFPQFYSEEDFSKTIQVILYYSPNSYKMQYYSLKPIGLELKKEISTENIDFKDNAAKKSELQERLKMHAFHYKSLKNSKLYFSENILRQVQ